MSNTTQKTHHMRLHPRSFVAVMSGEKKSELRINDTKRRLLSVDDIIVFASCTEPDKTVSVRVTSLDPYPTFRDLYRSNRSEFPEWQEQRFVDSFKDHYSPTEELENGVVRIGITVI